MTARLRHLEELLPLLGIWKSKELILSERYHAKFSATNLQMAQEWCMTEDQVLFDGPQHHSRRLSLRLDTLNMPVGVSRDFLASEHKPIVLNTYLSIMSIPLNRLQHF